MKLKQTLVRSPINPIMEYEKDIGSRIKPVYDPVNRFSGTSNCSAMNRWTLRGTSLLAFLFLAFFSFGQTEICGNGIDDDGDGLIDDLDPECYTASLEVIAAGSYIVNMGVEPQTDKNALKPYGMVWELIHDHQVPVKWAINPNKVKDGTDFVYNGTAFKGGPFIICASYRTAAVDAVIASWESAGVVGVTTTFDFTAPIERTINYSMNWTLDNKNGKIAEKYLIAAGIPNSAYNWVLPENLDCCNDVFVIPHADPDWDNHGNLLNWNNNIANGGCGGAIWAGCKAVSEMENIQNPFNLSERLNFLMLDPIAPDDNPAVWSGDHDDGTMPYSYGYHNHPIMQFLGILDGAQESGAEQMYMPTNDWRPSTHIGAYDPDHPDIPSLSNGPAAKLAFGYAFGDTDRGYVVYEASHRLDKDNKEENIAAQRAFLNFSFMAVGNKSIKPLTVLPTAMASGQSYAVSGSATGGSGNYYFEWTSDCGGSFSNTYAAATTFTAPTVSSNTTCAIMLTVTDDCGTRVGFENVVIEIGTSPEICDNGIDDDGDGDIDLDDLECQCLVPVFNFQNGSLVAGSASSPGAVYSFSEIIPGVDALVSVVSFSHNDIVLLSVDEPAATNGGYDWAFQPIIDYNWLNGDGGYDSGGDKSVTFQFDFVDATSGDPYNVPLMHMTAVDVDGNGADIREFVETNGFNGYYTESPTDLTLSGALRALGPKWAFNGVVETALSSMISFEYEDASSVTLVYGASYNGTGTHNNSSEGRMNCLYFKCYDFNTAVTCPSVTVTGGGAFCDGETATQTASVADGTGTCGIQWQSSSDGVANWSDISGATGMSYSAITTSAPQYFRAAYYCDGEPTCGTIYSNVSTVSMKAVGCTEICDNGIDDDGDGLIDGDDPDCAELEFCTYNLVLDFNETFNIRNFVKAKDAVGPTVDWSQVSFTYTDVGANDPTSPADWHLADFNNGLDVTVTAADAAPGTGNSGDGRYRIYLFRNGASYFDDHMTIRIEDGESNSASSLCFPEICGNGLDDDGDGLADCDDPDCGGSISPTAATSDANICPGESSNLYVSATGGTTPYQFDWSHSLGSGSLISVSPVANTTYTVTVTDDNGCSVEDQVTINVQSIPGVIPDPNITICSGDTVTIQAEGAGGTYSYFWDQGLGNGPLHLVSPIINTVYTVTVTNTFGCQSADNVEVIVKPLPVVDAGLNENLCTGFYTNLNASASGASAPYNFTWDNGLGTGNIKTINPLTTTTYSVTVESGNGCYASNDVTITVQPCVEDCSNGIDDDNDGLIDCDDPDCGSTVDLGLDVNICDGNNAVIAASVTGGSGFITYAWSNGFAAQSQSVNPSVTTVYSVTVTNPAGCTATDDVTVFVAVCTEDCTNGIDDDGDGLVDCDDPDCIANTAPHLTDDDYTTCPGMPFSERVTYNDANLQDPLFSIYSNPVSGTVSIDATGKFTFIPYGFFCTTETFIYQVCNQVSGCCAQATVTIDFGDNTAPLLNNIPADITISCDDIVPAPPIVSAFDECPGIFMDYEESTDQFIVGGCETFTITRTWTTTDFCGNLATGTQTITIIDQTAPEIFQVYTLESGQRVVAGVAKGVSQEWKYIPFPISFNGTPMVFTTVNTENDISAVAVRQRNQYSQGFQLRLSEEEGNDGAHKPEEVAWMAIEQGVNTGQLKLDVGRWDNVDHNVVQKFYSSQFVNTPALIASIQSSNDHDPANLRFKVIGKSAAKLYVQEETSVDAETAHGLEHVGYMAFDRGADLVNESSETFGETGQLNLTNAWATIQLTREYTKPVVIFGGISRNGGQGVDFRVRNVTSNSFQVRLQEWDYLDGSHVPESASYIVVEGSIPGNLDYYCSGSADKLQIGVNVFALDNCDDLSTFDYSELSSIHAIGLVTERSWISVDDCGNINEVTRFDTCTSAALRVKALLYGAFLNSGNDNLMRDDLRTRDLVPVREPYSQLPAFPHVEDHSPNNGNGNQNAQGNDAKSKITICHRPGTNAQHTLTINESALAAHLAHGDVVGECVGNLNNSNYKTIAAGDWSASSTWENGAIPPTGNVNDDRIQIEHDVTLSGNNLILRLNSNLSVVNSALILENGTLEVENGAAYFENATLDIRTGELLLTALAADFVAFNSTVLVGSNFKCLQGESWLENVLLDVGGLFENEASCSLYNMAAILNGGLTNNGSGEFTILDSQLDVKAGNFTNTASATINGDGLVIWVENGDLINNGSWIAQVTQYCVSSTAIGLNGYLPVSQDCAGLVDYFTEESVMLSDPADPANAVANLTPEEISGPGTIDPTRLDVSGENAIVDWILLEIRDPNNDSEILAYATVAMQRNGQLISEDGSEVIQFPDLSEGDYHVAVRHRNHLGLITNTPVFLSTDNIQDIDFTDVTFPVKGGDNAGRVVNAVRYLWAGDFNEDGNVIYQGPYNDVFHLFSRVLGDSTNEGYLANFIIEDYDLTDYNLDGRSIYQGPNNDRASLLYHTILSHMTNNGFLANYIVTNNLP